ncbi:hypothetical protein D3C71_1704440 [compost metagenome]
MDPINSSRTGYPQGIHLALSKSPHYLVSRPDRNPTSCVFDGCAAELDKAAGMRAKFGRRARISAFPDPMRTLVGRALEKNPILAVNHPDRFAAQGLLLPT